MDFKVPYLIFLTLLILLNGCVTLEDEATKSNKFHWVEDTSNKMTLKEVLARDISTQWNKASHPNANLGFTDSTVWLSLPFENNTAVSTLMLLEMAFPLHDSVNFYLVDGTEIIDIFKTGDQVPFTKRPILYRRIQYGECTIL